MLSHLLSDAGARAGPRFTRTSDGANRVREALEDRGVASEGDPRQQSQNGRQKALDQLQPRHRARVLVATDLASRGIDTVKGVTHVNSTTSGRPTPRAMSIASAAPRAPDAWALRSFCDSQERGQLRASSALTTSASPSSRRRQRGHAGWPRRCVQRASGRKR